MILFAALFLFYVLLTFFCIVCFHWLRYKVRFRQVCTTLRSLTCPHDKICPRLANSEDLTPCNFETTFVPTYLNKATNKIVTAKFSYVVLKKRLPEDNTRLWPRLIRPTLVRAKHAICRMCTSDGKLQEIIFTGAKHGRPVYRCAKATRWGDRLPIKIGETFKTKTKTGLIKKSKKLQTNDVRDPLEEEQS